jgi:type I restriction enzyme S subunit
MKYSGVEWIGNIPNNWEIRKVKQCFYISKEQAHIENPTILSLARAGVKVRDISNNEGQLAASYDNYNPVQPGDLLLNPMDLYSGANCSLSEVAGVISPAYVNLRKRVNLNPKFYDYFFKTQYWAMAMFAHGKGVSFDNRWTMNAETVLNYYLPFPSFEEQNKIVEFLKRKNEEINSLISVENQQIEKLEEYRLGLIGDEVFQKKNNGSLGSTVDGIRKLPSEWKILPMKMLFDYGKGLPITKENLVDSGVKVISYGQIHAKFNKSVFIDERLYRFVEEKYINDNPECIVQKHDYIFADTSEDLKGTCDFIHIDNDEKIFAGYHCIILKNKGNFNPYYLSYQFLTDDWREFFRCRVGGVKLFSLTKKLLSQGYVVLPPLDVQNQIVQTLNEKCKTIDMIIEIKREKIEKLEEYKKSLIFEYVTGKKEVIA